MSISSEVTRLEAPVADPGQPDVCVEAVEALAGVFGTEFALADTTTGQWSHVPARPPGANWDLRAEVCREVARHGRPEFIEEDAPFLVLAIPLGETRACRYVAVATFVTRPVHQNEDLGAAADVLGLAPGEAVDWAAAQTPWTPDALRRVSELALSYLGQRERVRGLEEESQSLSVHLASTYEEISLLYRLTRNLKISRSDKDLGRVALEWLEEVLPAQGIALQLLAVVEDDGPVAPKVRTQPELMTSGRFPIDNQRFTELMRHLDVGVPNQPVVVNRSITSQSTWPCPELRQMIAVPLAEGENLFGWLVGANHVNDEEFGTVEASLLSSVGTILGIHSGNIELYRQQSELLAGIVRALTSAIDAKDRYTCGHSDRVARIAVRLAQQLGCDAKTVDTIYLSGLLHDIGKIGIDDSVLRKPGKLTDEEFEHIKDHVTIGHRILRDLKKLDGLLPVVLHHHESWDGSGYPRHLPAEEIPLSARIVAVADAYDAMSSDRPYRKGMPEERIDEILRSGSGQQWDPAIIDAFFEARVDIQEIVRRERQEIEVEVQSQAY